MQSLTEMAVALIIGIVTGLTFVPARNWLYQMLRRKRGYVKHMIPSDYPAKVGLIFAGANVVRAVFTRVDRWEDAFVLFAFSMGAFVGCHIISCWHGLPRR